MLEFLGSLAPWQWAVIGGSAAGIVLLYFLKLRREPRIVPSTLIWLKTVEDLHVNRPFRWLRTNILLILQLLLLLLLLGALLRPTVARGYKGVARFIIALDNSASMGATDVSPSRLEIAKERAIEEIVDGAMDADDMAMVIAFNDTASVVCSYTSDKRRLRQAIQSVRLTHRSTDIVPAIKLASALANPATITVEGEPIQLPGASEPVPATLVLYSDGGFADVPDASLGGLDVVYVPIGESDNNMGIVTLAAREEEENPERLNLIVRVYNGSGKAQEVELRLDANEVPIGLEKLRIAPQSTDGAGFQLTALRTGLLSARLGTTDALPYDDVAYIQLRPPEKVRVALVTPGNRWLEAAMSTSEVTRIAAVDVIRPGDLASDNVGDALTGGTYALVISDGVRLPEGIEANTLLFGVAPQDLPSLLKAPVDAPVIIDWEGSHPLCQFVEFGALRIAKGSVLEPPPGAEVLARTTLGPIICELKRGYYRDCVVGFPLLTGEGQLNTDWPIRIGFPVFLMNVLRTYARAELAGVQESIRPGTPFELPARSVPPGSPPPVVLGPDNKTLPMKQMGDAFVCTDTDLVGLYRVRAGNQEIATFTVSMFDERESQIAPRETATLGAREITAHRQRVAVRYEIWPWLVALAIGVCILEWYVYNRRVSL